MARRPILRLLSRSLRATKQPAVPVHSLRGRIKFPTIADQNDYLLEAGYYVYQVKLQPFFKYESQTFVTAANAAEDVNRYGLGANYYIPKQNLKWTAQYLRAAAKYHQQ